MISLDGDHSNMIKFSDNDRDGYEKVCNVLQEFVRDAGPVIKNRIQSSFNMGMCLLPFVNVYAELNRG